MKHFFRPLLLKVLFFGALLVCLMWLLEIGPFADENASNTEAYYSELFEDGDDARALSCRQERPGYHNTNSSYGNRETSRRDSREGNYDVGNKGHERPTNGRKGTASKAREEKTEKSL